MKKHHSVIIIGGGIVGCSILYGLAKRGWTDCLLIERLTLTSGSTWHAAGNASHFPPDMELLPLYAKTIRAYQDAEAESGQSISFHQTGSIRLATNQQELDRYERLTAVYEQFGIPYRVIDKAEIARLHPLLVTDDLLGGAHTPADGFVDPTGATYALANAARARGSAILQNSSVLAIEPLPDGRWSVSSEAGNFTCDQVVLATSFWARELLEKAGIRVPLYPLEHHEIITESSEEIRKLTRELPVIRDPSVPANIRQERDAFLIGIYEKNPVAWATDGIPPEFKQELLPSNIDRVVPHLEKLIERLPEFARLGLKTINNGPICYTPDGMPLLGKSTLYDGLWLASGFTVGIGSGGGSGDYLAEQITSGGNSRKLPEVDPDRFGQDWDPASAILGIKSHYAAGYSLPDIPLEDAA